MKPTVSIERIDLIRVPSYKSNDGKQKIASCAKLRFRIKTLDSAEKRKIEIWQIRIVDHNKEVHPVYQGKDRLDHVGLIIGGRKNESDVFDTKLFEIDNECSDPVVRFILVDKSNNLGHRFEIQLTNGCADAEHFIGDENPIKLLELREEKSFATNDRENSKEKQGHST